MKYIFILLCIAGFACSKKEDKTYFIVTNTTGFDFKNVVVGYKETGEGGKYRIVQTVGDLLKNQTSTQYEVTKGQVQEVYVYFDLFEKTNIINRPYSIKKGELNPVLIKLTDDATVIYKTDLLYPKP
jgi:hypothetical protein